MRVRWLIAMASLAACPNRRNVPCIDDASCDLMAGGTCIPGPSERWCAYPDPSCPDGLRYSELDVGDGVSGACVEAPADAGVDAPRTPAFDVAFPKAWRFSVAGPISGYLLVINRGVTPLSMTSLNLVSITDDHPTAFARVTASPSKESISPGLAGGALSGLSQNILVDTGLVTETRTATTADYLSLEISNFPQGTYDIHVELKLELDGLTFTMPMTVHVVPAPTILADPLVGTRVTVFR
ncbi:MAG: hypothetical protein KIT31_29920 [Deltaproteobacteria bacterium]|nr:hypothetical protein [Deltaproteobacteria bacterium]